ncbi:hypothetical protein Ancab_033194, partial [Ancistrocladus abbreviatus]
AAITTTQKGNLDAFKLLLILNPSLDRILQPHTIKFSFTNGASASLHRVLSQNTGVSGCSGECRYTNNNLCACLDLCNPSTNLSATKFGLVLNPPYLLSNAAANSIPSVAAVDIDEINGLVADESTTLPNPSPNRPSEYDNTPPAAHIPKLIALETSPRLPDMTEIGSMITFQAKLGAAAATREVDSDCCKAWCESELNCDWFPLLLPTSPRAAVAGGGGGRFPLVKEAMASLRSLIRTNSQREAILSYSQDLP